MEFLFFVPVIIVKILEFCSIRRTVCYVCLRTACHVLPIRRTRRRIPRTCIFKYYACQAVARIERLTSDTCNAVAYSHACQAGATRERITSDACYAVAYRHACQAVAKTERILSDACNAVGYRHACQHRARSERIISDESCVVMNIARCNIISYRICQIDIWILFISQIFSVIINIVSKAGAIERRFSDACNAVWDCHACQAVAKIERILSDACYAVGYRHACQAVATFERRTSDACNAVAVG